MQLQEPTFYDFCTKFQEAIKNDYCISTDTDKLPCTIGSQFFAFLVKATPTKDEAKDNAKAEEVVKPEAVKPSSKKAKV